VSGLFVVSHLASASRRSLSGESAARSYLPAARATDAIAPGVVCCQHGWWQECKALELPGYDSYGTGSANPSLLIGSEIADPISGSLPHRSFLCRVRPAP